MNSKYKEKLKECASFGVYLKKPELKEGHAYAVSARNFQTAIWDGHSFHGLRFKFGSSYMASENHWDDGAPYGTVKPLYELE